MMNKDFESQLDFPLIEARLQDRFPILQHTYLLNDVNPFTYELQFVHKDLVSSACLVEAVEYSRMIQRVTGEHYKETYSTMADSILQSALPKLELSLKENLISVLYSNRYILLNEETLKAAKEKKFVGYFSFTSSLHGTSVKFEKVMLDFFFYPMRAQAAELKTKCKGCRNYLICSIKKHAPEGECKIVKEYLDL